MDQEQDHTIVNQTKLSEKLKPLFLNLLATFENFLLVPARYLLTSLNIQMIYIRSCTDRLTPAGRERSVGLWPMRGQYCHWLDQ